MDWLLLGLSVMLLPFVFLTGAALLASTSMRRANRLVPGRGRPPLRWLWSPSPTALLHRRLRSACQLAGALAGPPPRRQARVRSGWGRRRRKPRNTDGIAILAREVLEQAVVLDDQLLLASSVARRLGRAEALDALEPQVRAVEDAARRVQSMSASRAELARLPAAGALSLEQRISAMEAALQELAEQRLYGRGG